MAHASKKAHNRGTLGYADGVDREVGPLRESRELRLHRALGDGSRMRIMATLEAAGEPLDARAVAERVGLHLSTVRGHLDVLLETGLVTALREERQRPGRPRMLYALAEGRRAGEEAGYRLLAQILASSLAADEDAAQRASAAGRAWGAHIVRRPAPGAAASVDDVLDQLVALHERHGFEPEREDASGCCTISLRRCPFEEAVASYALVVCPAHQGLIDGALAALGGTVRSDPIEPHGEPGRCVARLRVASA
jgi:predicted ArsR family transcriptional regulator